MVSPGRIELDGSHSVLTPEYVEFNFVLAGLMSRFLALLIDTMVSILLFSALGVLVLLLSIPVAPFSSVSDVSMGMLLLAWFLIDWGYMSFLELLWSGQTIGKRALGLRVIQESGVRVRPFPSLLRNLVRPVDKLPAFYLVGAVAATFSRSHQRLGDMLAGTVVIRERRLSIPASVARPEGDTSLLADPHFRAKVSKLTAEEEAMLLRVAIRREELAMDARLKLFGTLAQQLQDDLGFAKPTHLSDEKLVLLVAAAAAARSAERSAGASPARSPWLANTPAQK